MRYLLVLVLFFTSTITFSAIKKEITSDKKWTVLQKSINKDFSVLLKNKVKILKLKSKVLNMKKEAVPVLVEVMKNGKYPEKNRWIATMLLGRLMGSKAAPFISKFSKHPSWVLRMAALKALLALSQKEYGPLYARLLSDKSLLVRTQALENINHLRLREYAPYVWKMLYDSKNYVQSAKGNNKRTHIIKKIITSVGMLNFKKAKAPLIKMIQNKKYKDLFVEIDQALSMITGKASPKGGNEVKKIFWKRLAISEQVI